MSSMCGQEWKSKQPGAQACCASGQQAYSQPDVESQMDFFSTQVVPASMY